MAGGKYCRQIYVTVTPSPFICSRDMGLFYDQIKSRR